MRQLYDKREDGDLPEWPWSPDAICPVVRVKFTNGSETVADKSGDLHARSRVAKVVAGTLILAASRSSTNRS